MFCKECGKVIPDDSTFCNYCGTVQEDVPLDEKKPGKKDTSAIFLNKMVNNAEIAGKVVTAFAGPIMEEVREQVGKQVGKEVVRASKKATDRGLKTIGIKKKTPLDYVKDTIGGVAKKKK